MERLSETRSADLRQGSTSTGPHKDDIQIDINGVQARAFGSQGQQRTAALSMKLAEIRFIEIEKGEKPVLLLDDVLSELDHDRQKYLIQSLSGSQLFITAADLSGELLKGLPQGFSFSVDQGKISRK
jgi:DNA replication and repair protein RecF